MQVAINWSFVDHWNRLIVHMYLFSVGWDMRENLVQTIYCESVSLKINAYDDVG